ncbi:MAG TPA: hypothetical protein VKV36_00655 [Acidimicrobiales bacterium]|nr:hypothetical protein [Acidimicrobiales bacterium]
MTTRRDIAGVLSALTEAFEAAGAGPVATDPHAHPPELLFELVKLLDQVNPIDEHGTAWHPSTWEGGLRGRRGIPELNRVLDAVEELKKRTATGDGHVVRRHHLHESAEAGVLLPFVAVMAWGYSVGRAWRRASRILESSASGGSLQPMIERLERLRDLARSNNPEALAMSWTSKRSPARVAGLGPAFASKFAYACAAPDEPGTPLIADRRAAWGFWAVTGTWDIRKDPDAYAEYVRVAREWAGDRCRPDEIERALFVLGPAVELVWKNYHGKAR